MESTLLENRINVFNPRKFIIWLLIVSSIMAFAGLTSAFLVMKSQDNKVFQQFSLPDIYKLSTVVVLFSSILIHIAYNAAKKNEINKSKIFVLATFVAGLIFVVMQIKGFGVLIDNNVYWFGRLAPWNTSLTYTLIAFHMFHLFLAMLVLIILLIKSFKEKVYEKNLITFHNCVVFWHFLGVLWVYLYLFLYISL